MSRLSVQLDGETVYLYTLLRGAYEEKRKYLCAHRERLSKEEVRARLMAAVALLPEEIEYDYTAEPLEPDLFEQAMTIAGFIVVDDEVPWSLHARNAHFPTTERERLEHALENAEPGLP